MRIFFLNDHVQCSGAIDQISNSARLPQTTGRVERKLNSGVHHPSYAFVPPPSSHLTPHHRDWIPHPTDDLQFCRLLIPTEVCGVKPLFRAQRGCAHVVRLPLRNNNRRPDVLSSKQVSCNVSTPPPSSHPSFVIAVWYENLQSLQHPGFGGTIYPHPYHHPHC